MAVREITSTGGTIQLGFLLLLDAECYQKETLIQPPTFRGGLRGVSSLLRASVSPSLKCGRRCLKNTYCSIGRKCFINADRHRELIRNGEGACRGLISSESCTWTLFSPLLSRFSFLTWLEGEEERQVLVGEHEEGQACDSTPKSGQRRRPWDQG